MARVRDVAVFVKGKKPSVTFAAPADGALPYVLIEGFGGDYKTFTNDPGCVRCYRDDTIVVADGANTGLTSTSHNGYLGSTLSALRPEQSKINHRYLFYFVHGNFHTLNTRTRGAAVPHLDKELLLDLELALLPLHEQERIVRILDEADALRRLHAAADKRADQLATALFEEIFGDPAANSGNWPVEPLGNQLALMEYGPRFYNEAYSASGTRIARITDMDDTGNLLFEDMPRMQVDPSTLSARRLQSGDFIFARSGATVGKLALVPEGAPPCIAGAYFIRFRLKDSFEPVFAREILRSGPIQRIVQQQSKQAAQPNFSGPLLRALPMILPPLSLQRDFTAHVAPIRELQKKQAASSQRLDDLFQSLLHRAFNGEL